jgi:transcriptional regulator with XRE-family HTH domain
MLLAVKSPSIRNPIDILVGAKLAELRQRLGFSQASLAERVGATVDELDGWEHGFVRVGAEALIELAWALEIPVSDFWSTL